MRLQEVGVGGLFGTPVNLKAQAKALGMKYSKQTNPNFNAMQQGMQAAEKGDILVYNGHGANVGGKPAVVASGTAPPGQTAVTYEAPGFMGATKTTGTAYSLEQMSQDISTAKARPSVVMIGGCEVSAADTKAITDVGVSVAIASGGEGTAAYAGPQIQTMLNALAGGKTVNDALAAANDIVRQENDSVDALKTGAERAAYSASFADGLNGNSTLDDIRAHNQTAQTTKPAQSAAQSQEEQAPKKDEE